ncbi:MAG: gliding motility-associated C-terminal domain-containing protein, partial [Flavobacteriales bacterium]
DTIPNSMSCDSLMTFNLTISTETIINNPIQVGCDSILFRGIWYMSSQMINDTISTGVCDTIYRDSLTINQSSTSTQTLTVCDSLISPRGKIWKTTGTYFDTIPNSMSCDSLMTFNLTVGVDTTIFLFVNSCDSFMLSSGVIAYVSGVYRDTVSSSLGCDSIIVTNLVVGQSSSFTQNISICSGETFLFGSNSYVSSGIYRDTFPNVLGCDSIIITNLTVNPLTAGSITFTSDLCVNENPVIFSSSPIGGLWSGPGINSTTGLFDPLLAGIGIHRIYYQGPGICGITDSADVTVFSAPSISAIVSDDECYAGIGVIDITLSGGTGPMTFGWSNGNTTEDLIGIEEGTYSLSVVDANGCSDRSEFIVVNFESDTCEYHIYLPNIFSPDGNGQNDVFRIEGDGVEKVEFKIFNRWGNLIFESTDQSIGWDGTYQGKPINQGVFVYMISGSFVNGEEFQQKGTVTLVRR